MKKLFLLTMVLMVIYSCSDGASKVNDEIEKPIPTEDMLKISNTELSFDVEGGEQIISVQSSSDWTLSGGSSWCTPSQSRGSNKDEVTFTITRNPLIDGRSAMFSFACGTATQRLVILQTQGELVVSPISIEVEATGGEAVVDVKTSFDYEYLIDDSCKDWVSYKDSRASQTSKRTFLVAANTEIQTREGKITIYYGDFSELVTIQQKGAEPLNVTVNVPQSGMLESVLSDYKLPNIESLTITGEIDDLDYYLIRNQLPALLNLNLSAATMTEIPAEALKGSVIKKCILPSRLTKIGESAFYNSKLEAITIPSSVETIEPSAFKYCKSLTTLIFEKGSNLRVIKGGYDKDVNYFGAFSYCTALKSVEIPSSVESIEATAFYNCASLTSATFEKPSNLKTIGGGTLVNLYEYANFGAFTDCSALKSIEIPASVEVIGVSAFDNCKQLASVTFESGAKIKEFRGAANSYPHGAFSNCTALTSITIPASTEIIGSSAFYNCTSLKTVTFEKPSIIREIQGAGRGYGAFSNCTSLKSIEIPASVTTFVGITFYKCTNLERVTFEKGSKLKSTTAPNYTSLGVFSNLENLTTFDASACTLLESVGRRTVCDAPKLTTVILGAVTPPTSDGIPFGVNDNCVLKVPKGSESAYKVADGWKEFSSIIGY